MKSVQIRIVPSPNFQQERSYYEEVIEKLTKENQLLRKQLQLLNEHKEPLRDFHRAQTTEDESSSADLRRSYPTAISTPRQISNYNQTSEKHANEQLIKENMWLRSELDSKSRKYEQKINELTVLLFEMKQKQTFETLQPSENKHQSSNSRLVDSIQCLLQAFERDRSAFISKIEELLQLISHYEQQGRMQQLKERQFQLQLSIANQQITILKRLSKSK